MRGTAISEHRARGCRRVLAAAVLAAAIALAFGATARAGLYWSAPSVISPSPLVGLSCPTVSLCVGADQAGDVVTSTDPTGGAGAWSSARIAAPSFSSLSDVACTPGGGLCVAVGGAGIFISTTPTGGVSAWQHVAGSLSAGTVSCPSEQLCVAGRSNVVLTSTRPTDASQPWSEAVLSGVGPIARVSCPSVGFCAATGGAGTHDGGVLTSSDPAGGAAAWQRADTGAATLFDVSCPTRSYCVAVGEEAVVTSSEPTGGSGAWQLTAVPEMRSAGGIGEIACASPSLCAVAGWNGFVASSTSPGGGAAAWETVGGVDGTNYLRAVSCPDETTCFAVDDALVAGLAAHRLTVATTGSGEGSVRSGPPVCPLGCTYSGPACPRNCGSTPFPQAYIPQRIEEIDCGVTEFSSGQRFALNFCSVLYPMQDAPALTAVPRPGSVFTGWSGDCGGRGGCAPTMSSDRHVTAAFEPKLALSAVSQLHRRWREPHRRSRAPLGTRFAFRLNRAATVTLAFVNDVAGRRVGGRCRRATRAHARAHRCIRHLRAGTVRLAEPAGAASVGFEGVVAGSGGRNVRLPPGAYTVQLSAASEGDAAPPRRLAFTIAG